MSTTRLESEVVQLLAEMSVNWDAISYEEFTKGFHAEATHFLKYDLCDEFAAETLWSLVQLTIMRLEEVPDYYTRIEKMEAEGRAFHLFA